MDTSLEEKFAIFFNQFKTDESIRFLFEFLEVIVNEYKANPVQVVEFLKEQNMATETNNSTNSQSVPSLSIIQPNLINVKTETIIEEPKLTTYCDIEICSSSDEAESNNIKKETSEKINKIKRECSPFSNTSSSSKHDQINESNKRKIIKSETEDRDDTNNDENSIFESIKVITENKSQSFLGITIKEEWLNLYYKTSDNFQNCLTVVNNSDVFNYLKEYVQLKNTQLIRVLMSLLLNIVEFKELRKRFLHSEYINIFNNLLIDSTDSIVYRALKLFVFLMSEGSTSWQTNGISINLRDKIIQDMDKIIEKWKSNKVKMMYSGSNLNSIIEMQLQNDNPICQKWSCWILSQAHFKPTDAQKDTVIKNLKQILSDLIIDKSIRSFARFALRRFESL